MAYPDPFADIGGSGRPFQQPVKESPKEIHLGDIVMSFDDGLKWQSTVDSERMNIYSHPERVIFRENGEAT